MSPAAEGRDGRVALRCGRRRTRVREERVDVLLGVLPAVNCAGSRRA